MPEYPFRLQIAGMVIEGTVRLAGDGPRDFVHTSAKPPAAAAEVQALNEPQGPGRPSYDAMLQASVKALGRKLRRCSNVSRRARLVLKHLAETHGAQELPALRTVTAYLTAPKVGRKYGEKTKRAKLSRNGEV